MAHFSNLKDAPAKLLLIDDEREVLEATRQYLSSTFNFHVDICESGSDALTMIDETRYDVIISDYEMEGINGLDLLAAIRTRGDDTPFIIFTGKGREEVVIEAFDRGADGYIMKGGEIRSQFLELAQKVSAIVQKKRTETELRELETQFKEIYVNSPIAIELYDESGVLKDINPACGDLFGVHSINDIPHFNLFDDPNIPSAFLERLKNGEQISYKVDFNFDLVKKHNLYRSSRQGVVTLNVQITPMYHGDHMLSGYLVQVLDITEEVRIQNNLADQKRFLNLLLETIPGPVFYKDTQGKYTGCNSAFENYIGLSKDQIIGKTVFDIAPAELARIYHDKDQELFDNPGVQVYESQVRYADGTTHDVIFQKASIINQKEEIKGLIGVMLDITERKKYEQALQKSEAYIRTVLDNLPVGIAVNTISPHIAFDYYNENFLKYYRIQADALIKPDAIWDSIYEDTGFRQTMKDQVLADCASGDPDRMHWNDVPITRLGEETTYISAMNIPIPESQMMISVVWDVTDRKRAEDKLKESNRLLEGMLDGIPDIIGIQKPDHSIIRYNRAGYEILDLSPEEVEGKPCYSFIGRDTQCEICATTQAIAKKKIVSVEKYVPELTRHLLCRSNPILDDSGEVQLIVEQLTDITARKQMEEAIRQSNQKLRLLTGLTRHDILNLLTAIHFYHYLALESTDIATIHQHISHAKEAGERIEATIGFTREYEEFGIASSGWQVIFSVIESAKREVSPGTIVIENFVSPSVEIYADPIIRKVFTTLLENAVRHGEKLTQIRFSTREEKGELIIVCEDDGRGIPVAEKNMIFGHKYGSNTGIGLFLSREILSITGLSIRECGIPGEGARFEIIVPEGKWRA